MATDDGTDKTNDADKTDSDKTTDTSNTGDGTDGGSDDGDDDDEGKLPDAIKAILAKNRAATKAAEKTAKDAEARAKKLEQANMSQAEKDKAAAAEVASELAKSRLENLRLRVGAKSGLPQVLIDRLTGTTEDELLEDAKSLKAALGVKSGGTGTTNDGKKTGKTGGPTMSDLLRMAAKGH